MTIRLATIGAALAATAFLILWLATSCPDSEARQDAERWADSAQVRLDRLEATQHKTDSLSQELDRERQRSDSVVSQARAREEAARATARAARGRVDTLVMAVEGPAGDSLEAAIEREREEHRTVVKSLREQMEAQARLLAVTDSARAAWRDRALAAEIALEAETARAEAWKREANPGLMASIRRDLPKIGAAVAVTAVVVSLAK